MRVVEPDNTAGVVEEIGIDPPEFPVVVRGYDRRRVNAYLQSMVSRLAAEHDRAVQAEQAVATPHHDWEFWWVDSDFLDDPRRIVRLDHPHGVSLGEMGPRYRQIP